LVRSERPEARLLEVAIAHPEDRTTLTESVTNRLRDLIIEGDLPPGTPLRMQALAARLGVSIMPVREALKLLEAEHLVAISPPPGATVLQVSSDEVEEIYAMRAALESLAARVAMSRIKPAEVRGMQRQLERMQRVARGEDVRLFSAEDRRFHRMLYQAAGRPALYTRIIELAQSSLRATNLAYEIWRPLILGVDAHRPILEAVERGDASAVARLTFEHVTEGGARIYAAVRQWEREHEGVSS
jgi:DNA-binding GntR family transcriptional regulator